jgi:hypothetical protein
VTEVDPADGAIDVEVDTTVSATFDEPMDAATVTTRPSGCVPLALVRTSPPRCTYAAGDRDLDAHIELERARSTPRRSTGRHRPRRQPAGRATSSGRSRPPRSRHRHRNRWSTRPSPTSVRARWIGTYVTDTDGGEVTLAPTVGAEFGGTSLPEGGRATVWNAGGAGTVVADGSLTVDGSKANTVATYGPGRVLEFRATFGDAQFQNAGFGQSLAEGNEQWAVFGIADTAGNLYARVNTGSGSGDVPSGPRCSAASTLYRIEWGESAIRFYVDGTLVHTADVSIAAQLRPIVSDFNAGGPVLSVDWLRMTPYASEGTFTSRVLDAGEAVAWGSLSYDAQVPPGTTLDLEVRTGDTSGEPFPGWSSWTALAEGGEVSGSSRFVQYRATLGTQDTALTPTLEEVRLSYTDAGIAEPGVLDADPTSLDFGEVEVGSNETLTISLTNSGGEAVEVTDVVVADSEVFSVTGTLPETIEPGASANVQVQFAPDAEGPFTANLTVLHSGSGSPLDVPLSGEGVVTPDQPTVLVAAEVDAVDPARFGAVGDTLVMTFDGLLDEEADLGSAAVSFVTASGIQCWASAVECSVAGDTLTVSAVSRFLIRRDFSDDAVAGVINILDADGQSATVSAPVAIIVVTAPPPDEATVLVAAEVDAVDPARFGAVGDTLVMTFDGLLDEEADLGSAAVSFVTASGIQCWASAVECSVAGDTLTVSAVSRFLIRRDFSDDAVAGVINILDADGQSATVSAPVAIIVVTAPPPDEATVLVAAEVDAVDPARFGAVGDTLVMTFDGLLDEEADLGSAAVSFVTASGIQCWASAVECSVAGDTLTVSAVSRFLIRRDFSDDAVAGVINILDADGQSATVSAPVAIIVVTAPPPDEATVLVAAEVDAVDPARFGAVGDTLVMTFDGLLDEEADLGSAAVSFVTASGIQCWASAVECSVAGDTLTVSAVSRFLIRRDFSDDAVAGVINILDADGQSATVSAPVAIIVVTAPPPDEATVLVAAEVDAVDPARFGAVGDTLVMTFDGLLDEEADLGSAAVSFVTASGIQCWASAVECSVAGDTLTVSAVSRFLIRRDFSDDAVAGVINILDADGQSATVSTPVAISVN